jgi:hypothetical protein
MTVCIAASCEHGRAIVLAADRLVTGGLQVEGPIPKVAMFAPRGAVALAGNESTARAIASLGAARLDGEWNSLAAREAFRSAYADFKEARVEQTILRPHLGVGFPAYRDLIASAPFSQILTMVHAQVAGHSFDVDLLVAVLDAAGSDVFAVTNPGIVIELGAVSSFTSGNGGPLATASLAWSQHGPHRSLAETVYNVAYAKRNSEIAAGVGRMTDILVVSAPGSGVPPGVFALGHATVEALKEPWSPNVQAILLAEFTGWAQPVAAAPVAAAAPGDAQPVGAAPTEDHIDE